jgi:hypothetical protein
MSRGRGATGRSRGGGLEARLRQWAEITELCLGLRGARLLGRRQARSWQACVDAGLRAANREQARRG